MKNVIVLILSILLAYNLFSQKIIQLDDKVNNLIIGKSILYLEDENHSFTFDEIKSKSFESKFVQSEVEKPNFGYSTSCYWLKFSINNNTPKLNDWLLTLDYAVLDYIDLYYKDRSGNWQVKNGGDRILFESKEYEQRYTIMQLDLFGKNAQNFYVRVETEGSYQLGLELQRAKDLYQKDIKSELAYGIYYGVLLIMVLYNFFLYFTIKDKNYLYYVLVVIANLMFFSSISGHSYQYLWHQYKDWGGVYAVPFSMGLLTFSTSLFAKKFLQIKKYSKGLSVSIDLLIIAGLLLMVFSFILSYSILSKTAAAVNGVTAIVVFAAGIVSLVKGNKSARYYVFAWSFYLIGGLILVLKTFGVFSPNFFTLHAVQLGSIMEAMLLSFALGDKYNLYRKETLETQVQMLEVERDAKMNLERKVEERTILLKDRNIEIEQKNTEIMDSIRYAKQIQEALLPEEDYFKSLLPNSFVFYRPKDIVSGDFYWCEKVGSKIIFAAVDCTGHGVPGAFMSIVGFNGLNKAVQDSVELNAGDLLSKLNNNVMQTLFNQKHEQKVKDGMDISLCIIDENSKEMEFSGAKNPLYIVRNKEVIQVKGDKISIAEIENNRFNTHEIVLEKNDIIYIFTDGFADQFGGEKKKKLNYPNFRNLLLETSSKPIEKQSDFINDFFDDWKKDEEQIDDICIIGVKIN